MGKQFNMIHALDSLTPGALWSFEEETYESLVWLDDLQEKPTKEAIEAEIVRLTEEYLIQKQAELEAQIAAQSAKESALAKLATLGLTEEEARIITGA